MNSKAGAWELEMKIEIEKNIKNNSMKQKIKKFLMGFVIYIVSPLLISLLIINIEKENQRYIKLTDSYSQLIIAINSHVIKTISIFHDYYKEVNSLSINTLEIKNEQLLILNSKVKRNQYIIANEQQLRKYYLTIDKFKEIENDTSIKIDTYIKLVKLYSNSETNIEENIYKIDTQLNIILKSIINTSINQLELNVKILNEAEKEKPNFNELLKSIKKATVDLGKYTETMKQNEEKLHKLFNDINMLYSDIHYKINLNSFNLTTIYNLFLQKPKKIEFSSKRLYEFKLLNYNPMQIVPKK